MTRYLTKLEFGLIAMAIIVAFQLGAWILGQNGAVFALTTAAIAAILGFSTGINFASLYYKKP